MARQVFHRLGSGARQVFGPADVDVAPPPPPTPAAAASFIGGHEVVWSDNDANPLFASSFASEINAGLVRDGDASFLYYAASAASLV